VVAKSKVFLILQVIYKQFIHEEYTPGLFDIRLNR